MGVIVAEGGGGAAVAGTVDCFIGCPAAFKTVLNHTRMKKPANIFLMRVSFFAAFQEQEESLRKAVWERELD